MSARWLYAIAIVGSAILLNCLASQRLEIAILAPMISIPCIALVLLGALAYGSYAMLYGRAIDGRFVLPKNGWLKILTQCWTVCFIVALMVGVPSILRFESVIRYSVLNDTEERVRSIPFEQPRIPSAGKTR